MSDLMRELQTYQKLHPQLIAEAGKFALIRGDELIGIFDTYGDALNAGYEKFELDPFMVQKISLIADVRCFERPVPVGCR